MGRERWCVWRGGVWVGRDVTMSCESLWGVGLQLGFRVGLSDLFLDCLVNLVVGPKCPCCVSLMRFALCLFDPWGLVHVDLRHALQDLSDRCHGSYRTLKWWCCVMGWGFMCGLWGGWVWDGRGLWFVVRVREVSRGTCCRCRDLTCRRCKLWGFVNCALVVLWRA